MAKKSEITESKKDQSVSLLLRTESFFLKLKKSIDGFVDGYCRLTNI